MGPPARNKKLGRYERRLGLLRAYRKPRKCHRIETFPERVLTIGIKSRASQGFKAEDQK
jgi:hypothetical protein